jgi:hypothetical protein
MLVVLSVEVLMVVEAVVVESANAFCVRNANGALKIFSKSDVPLDVVGADDDGVAVGGVDDGVGAEAGADDVARAGVVVGVGVGVTAGDDVEAGGVTTIGDEEDEDETGVDEVLAGDVLVVTLGVELGVLVPSRTVVHSELSVSVLTDEEEDWPGKITFQEKWSVTEDGVWDWSLPWNDPQNICACSPFKTAEFWLVNDVPPGDTSGVPAA